VVVPALILLPSVFCFVLQLNSYYAAGRVTVPALILLQHVVCRLPAAEQLQSSMI
jgi:hypothetical protein